MLPIVEAEYGEVCNDLRDSAEVQAGRPAGVAALEKSGTRDKIHFGNEAAPFVHRDHHHFATERHDVICTAAARKADLRMVKRSDQARVHVAEAIDLGAANE